METFISNQFFSIALAFGLGAVSGVCSDLVRPFRRRCGTIGKALTDLIFTLASATALFVFSMSAGNGRLGLWELTFALAGFLCYLYTVSDAVFELFDSGFSFLLLSVGKTVAFLAETKNNAKKSLKKQRNVIL